jgi:hypothetical protein
MARKCGGKRGFENVTISGKHYHLRSRGADNAVRDGKPKNRVGGVRPVVAVQRRGGRKPTVRKKTQTWTFAFFSTSRPPATTGGCLSPFKPLKDGFATGWCVATGERKPLLLSFERGTPGGEGEGQYKPPKLHHRSTISVKGARPWAGLLR